jgi:predicted CXXCH cytochrome family protein
MALGAVNGDTIALGLGRTEAVVKKILKSVFCMAFSVALTISSWAATHPVPLDPKQDPATCAQCHEDKTKGKSVHSAIAMGCTSCHEIRVNKKTTRVKLITTTSVALCVTCHADKKAADIKGKVHPPAVRDCVKCHDPHQSDNKNQLLKPAVGDTKDTNLCLSCHKTGVDVPKDGSRHAALGMGCDTCHVTHKTGERGKREFDFHLTKNAPALCLDCHDPKDAALQKAHHDQPFGASDCLTCHDPHQSAGKHLMNKFTHNPFAEGQCEACHQPAKDGKVVLTAASSKEVCLTCHSDKGEEIAKAKVQHPGAGGDCTDCHDPHAGNSPGFQKPNAVAVCLTCHADQAEQGQKAVVHQPAFVQGCFVCHEPHGSQNEHLLRAGNWYSLCMECHGSEAEPAKLPREHMITIFNGKVKLPEDYFSRIDPLPVKYGIGHPVEHHPVKDIVDPASGKVIKAVNCSTCHQPHSSKHIGLLIGDQENNTEFCATCHKQVK